MKPIEDLSVLVTGGGSGIGEGIAQFYIERGAAVTICGRRHEKIEAVAARLGEKCLAVKADITIQEDRRAAVESAVKHGGKLDVLVSNAGNMLRGDIDTLEEDPLVDIFKTNVIAGMLLTGLCKPHLAKRGGAIIF
ncbi:MAG: SDR family NAD(P)-dependent oxidoreductase, partial [Proteobacteria bacterium]|nr:SDR family NAD(P)-dependent oxidoreductase [Pseudomonadota bacterium]